MTPKQRKVLKDILLGNFLAPVKHQIDLCNLRNIEELIVSICIKGSLRLKGLSHVFSLTEGEPVKSGVNVLGFLIAQTPSPPAYQTS